MPVQQIAQPANARSQRTRKKLLDTARRILEIAGANALTMASVADGAQVTRRTVYMHFGTRGVLLTELFDHIASEEGLAPSLARVWAAPDAAAALDAWARHLANYHPRLLTVDRAIASSYRTDPDIAAYRQRIVTAKRAHCKRLAQRLVDESRLAPTWNVRTATDVLYALTSSDAIDALLHECGWTQTQLARRLAAVLQGALLTIGPEVSDPGSKPSPDKR